MPETTDLLYRFADFVLDTDRRELRRGSDLVAIAPKVFDLLEYLIKNRNRVVSKDDLIAAIWDGLCSRFDHGSDHGASGNPGRGRRVQDRQGSI